MVLFILGLIFAVVIINSCAPTAAITQKQGVQLWGENCQRCHNAPSPTVYDDKQWEAVGVHMQIRANLTKDEVEKVIDFLKSAN